MPPVLLVTCSVRLFGKYRRLFANVVKYVFNHDDMYFVIMVVTSTILIEYDFRSWLKLATSMAFWKGDNFWKEPSRMC